MKRKDFFKRIGLLTVASITTPMLVSEILREESKTKSLVPATKVWLENERGNTITLPKANKGMSFEFVNVESDGVSWTIKPNGNKTMKFESYDTP